MASYPRTFRASLFLLAIVGMGLVISGFGTWHFFTRNGLSVETLGFLGLTILFVVGLAEGLVARVVLGIDSLEIVSNFKRTSIPRRDIVRVVGEKGVPVALELQTGGWVKLPSLGAGPHPNTVRAWLRKQAPPDAGATIP